MTVAAALALAGCGGNDEPALPATSTAPASTVAGTPTSASPTASGAVTSAAAGARVPEGFDAVSVRVLPGTLPELCLWLAATAAERQQGLMAVTELGGADGMLFDFGGPTTGEFWMYQTLVPLSIAFFDADGAYVSSADMEPCRTASAGECPRYGAAGPYAYAVEVAMGDLERLGLVPGSRIEVDGTCRPS